MNSLDQILAIWNRTEVTEDHASEDKSTEFVVKSRRQGVDVMHKLKFEKSFRWISIEIR